MTHADPMTPSPTEDHATDIAAIARGRHTAKAYREHELSDPQVSDLLDLLRYSASSVNSQPWHLVVATTPEGRDRVARAGADADYSFNSAAIRKCGMVVVFAARLEADDAYLDALLEAEDRDGRFPEPANRKEMREIRRWFVDLKKDESGSSHDWMARQVYWNGGQFLLGAAALGLDATPMEGIDGPGLDAEFGLEEKGYRTLFAITVGRNADEDDWNYPLPKSRLPLEEIVTQL